MATYASIQTLAEHLTEGYWDWRGKAPRQWTDPDHVTVNLTDLTADEKVLARTALAQWESVCNINFVEKTGDADITFRNDGNGEAVTDTDVFGAMMLSATITISSDWAGGSNDIYSYKYQTYLHEIGHAIGLGHSGPYNFSGTYGTDNLYTNDTWQWSVMSYFDQSNFGGASYRLVMTPQMADIYAVQDLYGASTVRTGNTTYGFNATAGSIYDFTQYSGAPALTIYDSGGTDTLDVSGYWQTQTINLNPGSWSSVGGYTSNIGIYLTSTIENAVGGWGADTMYGNTVGNRLDGGGGNDTLIGFDGNDTLLGGAGADDLYGDGFDTRGNDTLDGGLGADNMYGGPGTDYYYVDNAGDRVIEGTVGETDYLYTTTTYTLPNNVEYMVLQESGGAINGFANNQGGLIVGNSFANALTGALGVDRLFGFGGYDLLAGNAGGDELNGGAGIDTVSYALSAGAVIVNLALATAQSGGDAAGDRLAQIENVIGSNHNDMLIGDSLVNILTGLLGKDMMTGGAGNDTFDFNFTDETQKGAANRDVIADFSGFGVEFDEIDLSGIDAKPADGDQAFKFIGDSKFHKKSGELRVVDKDAFFLVAGDINGDGKADFQIEVYSDAALLKDDFVL